ncbi:hypothetical protein C8Q76DRAFT_791508 [Earliella scabrosa]|nr:hypothetical protein C8Q76DRAFT_791508 [Earliella scabrosa]
MDYKALNALEYRKVQHIAKIHGVRATGRKTEIIERLLALFPSGVVPTEEHAEDQIEAMEQGDRHERIEEPAPPMQAEEPVLQPPRDVLPPPPTPRSMAEIVSAIRPQFFPNTGSPIGQLRPASFGPNFPEDSDSDTETESEYRSPRVAPAALAPSQPATSIENRAGPSSAPQPPIPTSWPRVFYPPTREELAAARTREANQRVPSPPMNWTPVFSPPARPVPRPQAAATNSERVHRPEQRDEPAPTPAEQSAAPASPRRPAFQRPTARELEADLLILEAVSGCKPEMAAEVQELKRVMELVRKKEGWMKKMAKEIVQLRRVIELHYVGVLRANPHLYEDGGDAEEAPQGEEEAA